MSLPSKGYPKRRGYSALFVGALCAAFVLGMFINAPAHTVYGQSTAQPTLDTTLQATTQATVQTIVQPITSTTVDAETQLFTSLYKQVGPSTVSIQVRIPSNAPSDLIPPDPLNPNGTPSPFSTLIPPDPLNPNGTLPPFSEGDASGFVYSTDGYIVTNAHVVQDADRVEVTFMDDATVTATVVGVDKDSDLAVIKVVTDKSRLIPATLADSDQVQIGQRVIAIGNPFGYNNSMSQGIISGLDRRLDSQASSGNTPYQIPGMIQTDTAINPGNSGGPLIDMNGHVVGINTLIESRVRQSSGVGFAVPSNLIKKFADLLIKNGKVEHSYLGIQGGDLTIDENALLGFDATQRGVLVTLINPGSPADKAGIKPGTQDKMLDGVPFKAGGDLIIAIDKHPIHRFTDLLGYLFTKTDIGQTVTITVLRDGKQIDLPVTLEARPHA